MSTQSNDHNRAKYDRLSICRSYALGTWATEGLVSACLTNIRTARRHASHVGSSRPFRVEKAIRPVDGTTTYLVLGEDDLLPHEQAKGYALFLAGRGHAENTQKAYIPRVCAFLNWCHDQGLDWTRVGLRELTLFKRALETTPKNIRGLPPSAVTINAKMTAVLGFLRYCALVGVIDESALVGLAENKYLTHLPQGMSPGENGQNRRVIARVLKAKEPRRQPRPLSRDEVERILAAALNTRDTFLVHLLAETGLRIGEALGLHRDDMHLLPDSSALGCAVRGAHVHVRRRINENGAYAKSHDQRIVPVTRDVVRSYADYMHERSLQIPSSSCIFVFVNIYARANPDTPMRYSNVKRCTNRLAKAARVELHPHALRHTAATEWVHSDVSIDTVQELLGHRSPQSTAIYLHSSDSAKREAVERVAQYRREVRDGA